MKREQLIKSEEYLEASIDSALYQSKKKSVQIEFIIDFIKWYREEYAKSYHQEQLRKIKGEIESLSQSSDPSYDYAKRSAVEIIDKHLNK